MIDQLVMDLIERETRTKELSFWVSFDPVSLEELGNMISANHSLEIFTETYDSCLIHFRGAFFPYEGRSLSTLGVIETNTFSEIRYCWE